MPWGATSVVVVGVPCPPKEQQERRKLNYNSTMFDRALEKFKHHYDNNLLIKMGLYKDFLRSYLQLIDNLKAKSKTPNELVIYLEKKNGGIDFCYENDCVELTRFLEDICYQINHNPIELAETKSSLST